MTREHAQAVLALLARASQFVPLMLWEMPALSTAIRALEAEAQEPAPPESTPPKEDIV
jgi:hypothetical protein